MIDMAKFGRPWKEKPRMLADTGWSDLFSLVSARQSRD